jgi:hypothetical protein
VVCQLELAKDSSKFKLKKDFGPQNFEAASQLRKLFTWHQDISYRQERMIWRVYSRTKGTKSRAAENLNQVAELD